MNQRAEFDFDQFLFRCTEEFMKLQASETRVIISGNDINYAPSLPLDSQWQEAGESVFRQVRFAAAFLLTNLSFSSLYLIKSAMDISFKFHCLAY